MRRTSLLVVALLTSVAHADEVRLRDGRVLIGTTKTVGETLRVTTLDGTITVPREEVLRIRDEAELRQELEALEARVPDSRFAHVQLARTAWSFGLYDDMWRHVGAASRNDQSAGSDRAAEQLNELLAELEPLVLPSKWRKASTDVRVRELLYRLRRKSNPSLALAVEELLVREPDADDALRRQARGARRDNQRITALRALVRRGEENTKFVFRSTIIDQ